MKYIVEFDYQGKENGNMIPMQIKTGFTSEIEAQKWAQENTNDGKVIGMTSSAAQVAEMLYR